MIYVLTRDHHAFQAFLYEFHCREHFGSGGNKEGQVRYLHSPEQLRGWDRGLVLTWGDYGLNQDTQEIFEYCAARDIPVVHVPDLRRVRWEQERQHKEARVNRPYY